MREKKNIWIFLTTNNVGGAELRFFGLWKYANTKNIYDFNFYLVGSSLLFEALINKEKENYKLELRNSPNFFKYDLSGSYLNYKSQFKLFLKNNIAEKDILHFVDGHPLIKTDARQIFSITQSSLRNLNIKGKISQFIGAKYADVVDVLDPNIFKLLKTLFFNKKNKVYITTNSYCDVDKFETLPFEDKKDWFVFLGRFEHLKQVDKLIDILPDIYNKIKGKFTNDLKFVFLGYGSMDDLLREKIKKPSFKEIPILIQATLSPQDILKYSKFFFSLQLNNNYPSRSLIEAMCSGNIPICTDVGQTKWLAKPEFSFYVPEYFTFTDFEKVFNDMDKISKQDLTKKGALARQTVMNEHTIEKMFDYYFDKYKQLTSA